VLFGAVLSHCVPEGTQCQVAGITFWCSFVVPVLIVSHLGFPHHLSQAEFGLGQPHLLIPNAPFH